MYLSGLDHPNFRTLCNFRRENRELIDEAFRHTVTIARELRILSLGHLTADGKKLKANASNAATLSREELEELRQLIERGIAVDEAEDERYGETGATGSRQSSLRRSSSRRSSKSSKSSKQRVVSA